MKADTVSDPMSDTSIRVTNELADELFDRKQRGESYEDVIWRLIEEADEDD
jgi:predicted CopG family antitoxin